MRFLRVSLLCLGAVVAVGSGLAQEQAPAGVEQALRDRITRFFQAHVDGKPRLAMPLVAEDSQDYFFGLEKPKYLGFEIASIKFSDNFTKAVAVVECENEMLVPVLGKQRVKVPRTTNWRLENGEWMWFVSQTERDAPKAPAPSGAPSVAAAAATPVPPNPAMLPQAEQTGPSGVAARVAVMNDVSRLKADKNSIMLQAGKESFDVVTVRNPMPGWVTVEVFLPDVPGLTARIEKKDIEPNGSGEVRFEYKPAGPLAAMEHRAVINLLPMGRQFPVRIVFQPAPPPTPAVQPPAPAGKQPAAKKRQKSRK